MSVFFCIFNSDSTRGIQSVYETAMIKNHSMWENHNHLDDTTIKAKRGYLNNYSIEAADDVLGANGNNLYENCDKHHLEIYHIYNRN